MMKKRPHIIIFNPDEMGQIQWLILETQLQLPLIWMNLREQTVSPFVMHFVKIQYVCHHGAVSFRDCIRM